MDHFKNQVKNYKNYVSKISNQKCQMKWKEIEKELDFESFNKKQAAEKERLRQKQKEANLESFMKKQAAEKKKTRQTQKAADLESFKKKNLI